MINQHLNLPWNFMTHGFLGPSAFPDRRKIGKLETRKAKIGIDLGSLWPFRRAIQPECEKVRRKSRNGLGRQKSQKRAKNELKSVEKVSFELVFNSFRTFLPPPGPGGSGNPFRDFFRTFSHSG